MRRIIFSLAVLSGLSLSAQNLAPLTPTGPMPELYRCASHTVVDQQIAQRTALGDPVSPDEQDFMREMSYYSQQRMFSGFILFNDSLSDYVQRVANEILKNDTATRNKLHFYVYKDADPNAYTSATGTIIVTVGLLAQLENEAQLAYILCHEITHFRNEHMLKGYLQRQQLRNNTGTPYYQRASNALSYSQEQELEADAQGFKLFLESSYSKKEALRSFDVLEYSNLPFDDLPFDTLFFNIDYLKVPVGYYMKDVDPIYSDDNYDDQNSTHPNVRKRRMALMTILDSVQNKEGKLFIVSKEDFLHVREASRYELCRLYLDEREYPDAIYASYMMLQKYPNDLYFKKIIARSIYELAAYEQNGKSMYDPYGYYGGSYTYGGRYSQLERSGYYRIPDPKDHPGQQQQLYSLFSNMAPDELTCLALAYNWNVFKSDPKDSLESGMCDSLFSMLVNNQNLHFSYFSTITPDSARAELKQDSLARVAETGETGDSKFSRLDKFKLSSEKERFTKFAFVNQLKDSSFVNRFKYYTEHRHSWVEYYDVADNDPKKDRKDDAADQQYGFGIDRIIIAGPDYELYKQIKRDGDADQDYTQSEIGNADMTTMLANEAGKAGVQTIIMNPYTMNTVAGDTFSDLAMLNEWFYERLQHGSHSYAWNISNQHEADSIADKYKTRYVMFTAVEANYYKRIERPVLYGISCVAIFPLYKLFVPAPHKFVYDVAILDLKTGEVIYEDNQREYHGKEKDKTSAFYANIFKQMKKPVEPKPKSSGDVEKDRGM